jgi:Chromo (CHRromatin Organisation MOdifier) domain
VEGEEEWIVEEILDSKVISQKLQYLVKWEGFGMEHNAWESWHNVHPPDLIADFIRNIPEQLVKSRLLTLPLSHFV